MCAGTQGAGIFIITGLGQLVSQVHLRIRRLSSRNQSSLRRHVRNREKRFRIEASILSLSIIHSFISLVHSFTIFNVFSVAT